MISPYARDYLPQARETMGAMLDYAVWDCQRQKDILKANVSYVIALAHVLGCDVEDILDYV